MVPLEKAGCVSRGDGVETKPFLQSSKTKGSKKGLPAY